MNTHSAAVSLEPKAPPSTGQRAKHLRSATAASRQRTAEIVKSALSFRGVSMSSAASRVGVDSSIWADKMHGLRAIWLEEIVALGPELACVMIEQIASDIRPSGLRPETHAMRIAAEAGQLAGAVQEALLDGAIDDEERSGILRRVDSLARATESARIDLEACR